jgi:hypothetical protein
MGRNCSDALKALVSRIVWAVGLREAVDLACVLLAPVLFPFVVLPDPAVFVPLALVFPVVVFPVVAALLLLAGFVVCSVAAIELCVWRATTPLRAHGTIIPTSETAAIAPRSLPQMLVTVSAFFRPTHPL